MFYGKELNRQLTNLVSLGLFKGGFTACAVGVSSALIFGYISSWIFKPHMKKK